MPYHINPTTGNVSVCKATKKCPFGDLTVEHYDTPDNARQEVEYRLSYEQAKVTPPAEIFTPQGDQEIIEYYQPLYEKFEGLPRMEGGHRVTYFLGNGEVVKLPKTFEGEAANGREVVWSKRYGKNTEREIPIADARWEEWEVEGKTLPGLVMEEVTPILQGYSRLPGWVGFVDSGQVGFDSAGRLVAYDL